MDRGGIWRATVHGITRVEHDRVTKQAHTTQIRGDDPGVLGLYMAREEGKACDLISPSSLLGKLW